MQLLAARVRERADAECVFHDHGAWVRARLADIRTDAWGVRARVEVVPAPGAIDAGQRAFDLAGSWSFLRVWPTHWSLPWASWTLVFDPAAVAEFTARAAEAAGRPEGERAREFDAWLRGRLEGWMRGGEGGEGGARGEGPVA